jgi:hypothetical protein
MNTQMNLTQILDTETCTTIILDMTKNPRSYEWAHFAHIMYCVHGNPIYQYPFKTKNFSAFQHDLSKRIGRTISSLWRYYTSYKFYIDEVMLLSPTNTRLPQIVGELSTLSVENIEILGKIHRVIPHNEYIDLVDNVFTNTILRQDLRDMWRIYKPLLQGQSKRLHQIPPRYIDTNNELDSSKLLHMLRNAEKIPGFPKYNHMKKLGGTVINTKHNVDCLIITSDGKQYDYHSVNIINKATDFSKTLKNEYDFNWLVCKSESVKSCIDYADMHNCGVIEEYNEQFKVVKQANKLIPTEKAAITDSLILNAVFKSHVTF